MSNQLIMSKYEQWLNSPKVSSRDKSLLATYSEEEIADAFYRDVEFGTAGLRGILGPGTNRVNYFTIRKAAVAFALALLDKFPDAKTRGVAIAHDNRHMSRELTLDTAETFNRMGINTYIFNSLRPTPVLSYAVRYSNCVGGVMITASHNPKNYNGFKVYDETGCQLVPDKLAPILAYNANLPEYLELEIKDAPVRGINTIYDDAIDDAYLADVKSIQINPNLAKEDFKIVYSPEHGASYYLAMKLAKELGYNVYPVESQVSPDPDFSGTLSPNPEDPKAYIEAIKLANEVHADVILITDPDADRVGVAYLDADGTYHLLTGNVSGTLLLDYVLGQRQKRGLLNELSTVYSTIVTSSFAETVTHSYGVKYAKFLTGFKFIGEAIEKANINHSGKFEFGFEESYGCLISDFVRDKDAIQALVLYAEMANYYRLEGKTLGDAYEELQVKHGYQNDISYAISFPGPTGDLKMKEIMYKLRSAPLRKVLDKEVICYEDYLSSVAVCKDGTKEITLPTSDVLAIHLADKETIIVRPSGTEPKIKFYYGVSNKDKKYTQQRPRLLHDEMKRLLNI